MESEITKKHLLKKHCDTYRICKKVVERGNQLSGGERMLFKKRHANEYQLHEYEKEELTRLGINKLPSAERLLAEIDRLQNQKSIESENRQTLIKQQKNLSAIRSNFEKMLETASITIEHNAPIPDDKQKTVL